MNKTDLHRIAKECLEKEGLLKKPGGILYSSHETLKPGDVYLMGLNPGGEGAPQLSETIDELLTKTDNAFVHGKWEYRGVELEAGQAKLQKRVKALLEQLVGDLASVCACNLIFVQSRKATDIPCAELALKCWPVHEAILDIVRPRLILCFGNSLTSPSPYAYLRAMFSGKEDTPIPSGHGNWVLRGFSTTINGRPVYVAGIPHLSYYSPMDKPRVHVLDWLRQKLPPTPAPST